MHPPPLSVTLPLPQVQGHQKSQRQYESETLPSLTYHLILTVTLLDRGSIPDLGLKLGLFDYCTSHIFQKKKTIFPVLPDRRRFGVNRKMLANPESQYNPSRSNVFKGVNN